MGHIKILSLKHYTQSYLGNYVHDFNIMQQSSATTAPTKQGKMGTWWEKDSYIYLERYGKAELLTSAKKNV